MASTIAFVVFDLLGTAFLLWCLANFIREDRRNRGTASVRIDSLPAETKAVNVVTINRRDVTWNERQARITAQRDANAARRSHRG